MGFIKRGDMILHDNATIHVNGDTAELKDVCRSLGIDVINLPAYSPELNPIELVFNIIVQRFSSRFNESNTCMDEEILQLLHSVVDSITPDVVFSCYKKCGCLNF